MGYCTLNYTFYQQRQAYSEKLTTHTGLTVAFSECFDISCGTCDSAFFSSAVHSVGASLSADSASRVKFVHSCCVPWLVDILLASTYVSLEWLKVEAYSETYLWPAQSYMCIWHMPQHSCQPTTSKSDCTDMTIRGDISTCLHVTTRPIARKKKLKLDLDQNQRARYYIYIQ